MQRQTKAADRIYIKDILYYQVYVLHRGEGPRDVP